MNQTINASDRWMHQQLDEWLSTFNPSETVYCFFFEDFKAKIEYSEVKQHCHKCTRKTKCYELNLVPVFEVSIEDTNESEDVIRTKRDFNLYPEAIRD